MASTTIRELNSYDGVIAVGGDGFFNEILNGLLSSRHHAPYPPAPTDLVHSVANDDSFFVSDPNETVTESSCQNEDQSPLLLRPRHNGSGFSNFRKEDGSCNTDQDPEFPLPNEQFRFGIIPAGSTDAIVICTTGTRDPITAALHIVLGKRVCLDIAQVVRWKTTSTSRIEPCVRYAASFAGYGFYGDVITESEKYRWMGPKRYDYAGTKVFLRHRSYEAEIGYLEVKSEKSNSTPEGGRPVSRIRALRGPPKSERVICRVNCNVCNTKSMRTYPRGSPPYSHPEESRWLKSKGRFLSIGAAVISCRNDRAPDGLVADAHLSDGFLHLILIKDCPHAFYLWHLTQLARKGGNPLNHDFVEHHKILSISATREQDLWNGLFNVHISPLPATLQHPVDISILWISIQTISALIMCGISHTITTIRERHALACHPRMVMIERDSLGYSTHDHPSYIALIMCKISRISHTITTIRVLSSLGNACIPIALRTSFKAVYPWHGRGTSTLLLNGALSTFWWKIRLQDSAMGKGAQFCYALFMYVILDASFSHKVVAYWGEGTQFNAPVQRDPLAGVSFRGRSYRLNGSTRTSTPTNTSEQQPNPAAGGPFRGRSYRLSGR
ncbi:hypothetical protein L1049_020435 [Liquidambar formosana]|uniref:DAGKc domain-containing protein n=1 Tax=Liquidambar formosana TaxID=63359 RepID=A0AAP0X7C5_LIQFO